MKVILIYCTSISLRGGGFIVKVCSLTDFYDELTAALKENNIAYTDKECLGRCDLCHSTAFVQKGDEFISKDSIEAPIEKIKG